MSKCKSLAILAGAAIAAAFLVRAIPQARADFIAQCGCSDVLNYGILYTGGGGNTLNVTNDTITGNIGIAGTGNFHADSSQSVINGRLDFSGTNTAADQMNGKVGPSPINFGVTQVQTDVNALGTLSTTLAGETGANVAVNVGNGSTQTINASNGNLVAGSEVFNLTSFSMVNGSTLDIQGTAGQQVVLNYALSGAFSPNGSIVLTGGLTVNDVLFNIEGQTLQAAANGGTESGIFLDINGPITLSSTNFNGHLFGGDSANLQFVSNTNLTVPAPLIGHGLFVLLAVGGVLFGGRLLERSKRRRSHAAA